MTAHPLGLKYATHYGTKTVIFDAIQCVIKAVMFYLFHVSCMVQSHTNISSMQNMVEKDQNLTIAGTPINIH